MRCLRLGSQDILCTQKSVTLEKVLEPLVKAMWTYYQGSSDNHPYPDSLPFLKFF